MTDDEIRELRTQLVFLVHPTSHSSENTVYSVKELLAYILAPASVDASEKSA